MTGKRHLRQASQRCTMHFYGSVLQVPVPPVGVAVFERRCSTADLDA